MRAGRYAQLGPVEVKYGVAAVFINAMPSLCEVYTEGIVLFDHRCG
jgi:hypothetical protein